MLNLISLELKKVNVIRYVRNAFIADLIIFFTLNLVIYIAYTESDLQLLSYSELLKMMESSISITFMIFSGVLLSKLIIGEYRNKTIEVLFCYPISRKKIILSKLISVAVFTFISVAVANILMTSAFYMTGFLDGFLGDKLTLAEVIVQIERSPFLGLTAAMIGLIPLYFGFRKKSVSATIVSSVIVASVVTSNNNGFSLYSIIPVSIALSIIGGVIAYMTAVRNIEERDVIS